MAEQFNEQHNNSRNIVSTSNNNILQSNKHNSKGINTISKGGNGRANGL